MATLRVNNVLDAACPHTAAAADADARCVEFLLDETGRGDGARAAEDVEDGGAEMGEAEEGGVLFGAVDGGLAEGLGVEVVVGDEGGVGDCVGFRIQGGPEGADEGEDFLVFGCGEADG